MSSVAQNRSRPAEFFEQVLEAQRRAALRETVHEYCYEIAGFKLRLTFAGDALVPVITPALAHLRVGAHTGRVDLEVVLWDAASTGVNLPPRPWGEDDYVSRGDIRGFEDPVIRTAYTLGPNALSMLDTQRDLAVFCSTSAEHMPTDYRGSPLLVILHWWMGSRGLQYIHAGAVGLDGRGVLLVGKGGSGKSTSALSCLTSELGYVSDDYCLLDTRTGCAHSIYNSAKLEAGHLENLPHLVPLVSNKEHLDTAKAVVYVHDHYPERMLGSFDVKAILIPRVTGKRDTLLSPASSMAGLKALVPSTLFQLSGAGEANFKVMSEFVRHTPSLYLDAGTDLAQIPRTIARYLQD